MPEDLSSESYEMRLARQILRVSRAWATYTRENEALADLDAFVDERADKMTSQEMKAFQREAKKLIDKSKRR